MTCIKTHFFVLLLAMGTLAGCETSSPSALPGGPLESAVGSVGLITHDHAPLGAPQGEVIAIADRHSVDGRGRVSNSLREKHRQHRLLIDALVIRDFTLLGCEAPLGDVMTRPRATAHAALVRRASRADVLDEKNVFQPVRYRVEHAPRLQVFGVEDPSLFAGDLEIYENWFEAKKRMTRRDISSAERQRLASLVQKSRAAIVKNVGARGDAAAENLVALMHRFETTRAALLLGGAHLPAAVNKLTRLGYRVRIFRAHAIAN